jgi:hypothetical protein
MGVDGNGVVTLGIEETERKPTKVGTTDVLMDNGGDPRMSPDLDQHPV